MDLSVGVLTPTEETKISTLLAQRFPEIHRRIRVMCVNTKYLSSPERPTGFFWVQDSMAPVESCFYVLHQ